MFENVKWKENGKIKLMIIVGTRPEIIRLAAVIRKCRKYFDTILVHTVQIVVVILTCVGKNAIKVLAALFDNSGKSDDFRSCTNDD